MWSLAGTPGSADRTGYTALSDRPGTPKPSTNSPSLSGLQTSVPGLAEACAEAKLSAASCASVVAWCMENDVVMLRELMDEEVLSSLVAGTGLRVMEAKRLKKLLEARRLEEMLVIHKQAEWVPLKVLKTYTLGLSLSLPPIVVGVCCHGDTFDKYTAEMNEGLKLLFLVRGPLTLFVVITITLLCWYPFKLGNSMLVEISNGVSMKDAIVISYVNTATVSTLLLGIALGMLHAGVSENPVSDNAEQGGIGMRSMWYTNFLAISLPLCGNAILNSMLIIYYLSPLSAGAAMHFAMDNMNYLGGPLASVAFALYYVWCAVSIWIFRVTNDSVSSTILTVMGGLFLSHLAHLWKGLLRWQNHFDGPSDNMEREYREDLTNVAWRVRAARFVNSGAPWSVSKGRLLRRAPS